MHNNCSKVASIKIICEAIDCLSYATEEIKISAGELVIPLYICKNCISKFYNKQEIQNDPNTT